MPARRGRSPAAELVEALSFPEAIANELTLRRAFGALLDRLEYDTVYHEHLSYFSVRSLLHLCERVGLAAVRIDQLSVHGGSLRLYLSRSADDHASAVRTLLAEEQAAGLTDVARYRRFAHDVEAGRAELVALLEGLAADGKRVAGYGAPAKGNTLLNYCGVGPDLVAFTVDRNPHKQGCYLPGTRIPIRHPEYLRDARPDYLLLLPCNLRDEIVEQVSFIRTWGGQFVVPIPDVSVHH